LQSGLGQSVALDNTGNSPDGGLTPYVNFAHINTQFIPFDQAG